MLSWLEAYGRRVVNGRRVLELEMSKVDQLTALRAAGIDVPSTLAVIGHEDLLDAATKMPTPSSPSTTRAARVSASPCSRAPTPSPTT